MFGTEAALFVLAEHVLPLVMNRPCHAAGKLAQDRLLLAVDQLCYVLQGNQYVHPHYQQGWRYVAA